jgi:hypothetical protein
LLLKRLQQAGYHKLCLVGLSRANTVALAIPIKAGCGSKEARQIIASAVIASRSARGIFLEPRSFVVTNVAMTKLVVTSQTRTRRAFHLIA